MHPLHIDYISRTVGITIKSEACPSQKLNGERKKTADARDSLQPGCSLHFLSTALSSVRTPWLPPTPLAGKYGSYECVTHPKKGKCVTVRIQCAASKSQGCLIIRVRAEPLLPLTPWRVPSSRCSWHDASAESCSVDCVTVSEGFRKHRHSLQYSTTRDIQ